MNAQDNLLNDSFVENEEQTTIEEEKTSFAKATKPAETRITGWTSLKEFSVECGITYEAVRQQVQKHSAVLDGHIKTIGKTRYLDSYAKKFLRGKKVNAKEPETISLEPLTTAPSVSQTVVKTQTPNMEQATQTTCSLPTNTKSPSVTSAQITEKLTAQKNEITELKKKVRSLEDEIKQIEYDNVLSQSIIASMNVREFKNWKEKFKAQMRDTMDI